MGGIGNNGQGRSDPFAFTERDRTMFEQSYLTLEMVKAQGWWRAADSTNGADAIGHKPTALKDYNGIVIVYHHPITGYERERVLRLDNPERDADGKAQGKYRGPVGRTNMFYIPLGVAVEWLKDISIPVVFCEGEKREKLSPEERKRQADSLRESAGLNTEALAADVLGSKAAKHILRLWAEAGLSDETVRLLLAWEALGEGRKSFDYHYADLYPLLYKCDGSEFEQTPTGGRILKSSCRKRLKERIDRAEAEQDAIGLTFAYHTPGTLDELDNHIPSHVDLYSRGYVAEVMILAESLPGYARSKKAARASAYKKFVSEKSGIAYRKKPPKRINRSKQIADGLQVIKGRLAATLKRMQLRGDTLEQRWQAIKAIAATNPAGELTHL